MPVLAESTWVEVVFKPFKDQSWADIFSTNGLLSNRLLQAVWQQKPTIVWCPNSSQVACWEGWGVGLSDDVIMSHAPVAGFVMETKSLTWPLRAAKDKFGNLHVVTDYCSGAYPTLKRYSAVDVAAFKTFL